MMMMALDTSRPTTYRNDNNNNAFISTNDQTLVHSDQSSQPLPPSTTVTTNNNREMVASFSNSNHNHNNNNLNEDPTLPSTSTRYQQPHHHHHHHQQHHHHHNNPQPSSSSSLTNAPPATNDTFMDENDVQFFWYQTDQMSYSPSSQSQGGNNGQIYHLKILVPAVAAGAIIGKGGETIGQLQKETGTRVKMSKSNDFYPGTNERVCLISGPLEGIIRINEFIMEKIKEKPDPNAKMAIDFDNKQPAEREKQVKILVPNSTAGMIIGKGGAYIKSIKEESGAYVQISQKSLDHALAERCITVIGDNEANKKACHMILLKIVEDPQSGSCLNVSYADVTGPVANFNPTGSPYANVSSSSIGNSNNSNPNYSSNGSLNSMSPTLNNSFNGNQNNNSPGNMVQFGNVFQNAPSGSQTQMIENFRSMLRACGYNEDAVNEICAAMATLANYGMLGLGLGLNGMINGTPILGSLGMGLAGTPTNNCGIQMSGQNTIFSQGAVPGLDQSCTNVPQPTGNGGNNLFGPVGSVGNSLSAMGLHSSFTQHNSSSGGRQDRLHMADGGPVFETFRSSPSLSSPGNNNATVHHPSMSMNSNSFGIGTTLHSPNSSLRKSPTPTDQLDLQQQQQSQTKFELEVSDNIIGAILGHGGKLLVELQRSSGANIQISKKGIFAPGTRNRIVTINGSQNSIQAARMLIEHQINEEESKRSSQHQQQQQQQQQSQQPQQPQQPISSFLR